MCSTSITCGNPGSFTLQIDEVHEARMKKESATTARASFLLAELEAAPVRKRAAARESTTPAKVAA